MLGTKPETFLIRNVEDISNIEILVWWIGLLLLSAFPQVVQNRRKGATVHMWKYGWFSCTRPPEEKVWYRKWQPFFPINSRCLWEIPLPTHDRWLCTSWGHAKTWAIANCVFKLCARVQFRLENKLINKRRVEWDWLSDWLIWFSWTL